MGLTKSEKDFWVKELDKELADKNEEYRPQIDECLEIAKAKALEKMRMLDTWEEIENRYVELEEIHAKYEAGREVIDDLFRSINKKLEGYKHEYEQYGSTRVDCIQASWDAPAQYHPGLNETWLDKLAKSYFLDEVMEEEGVVEPLEIRAVRKTLKRSIMLATTSTQLKEFLEEFMQDNEIEL